MDVLIHIGLLVLCIVGLYFACEWFLNAVEWLGARLNLGSTAVGSILAAIGTAMPESIITLMALLFGSHAAREGLAVGSALGGPLVVSTVASAAAGITLILNRRRLAREATADGQAARAARQAQGHDTNGPALGSPLVPEFAEDDLYPAHPLENGAVVLSKTEHERIGLAQKWFIATFVFTTILGMVAFPGKSWLGIVLFVVYALYFRAELKGEDEAASDEGLDALRFQPKAAKPAMWAIVTQIAVCLVVMLVASETFVKQVEWAGEAMGIAPIVVALLLCPVATELPETLNAIIWARQGKARLALANVAGSMIIQGTIPAGLAMLGSPWMFDMPAILASAAIIGVAIYLWAIYRKARVSPWALVGAFGFYVAFAIGLLATSL